MSTPTPIDPRPVVVDGQIVGARCSSCGAAVARTTGRCDLCGSSTSATPFGPRGTVWSATTVHIPVGERPAGFVLASVDLDGDPGSGPGPRLLTRSIAGEPAPGDAVDLVGVAHDGTGDLLVERDSQPASHSPGADLPLTTAPGRPSTGLASPATVAGVGTSHFGRFAERRIEELAWDAITEAIADAEVDVGEIDAAIVGSVFGPPGLANRVLAGVGLAGVPVFQVEAACASGTVAFHEACQAVGTGRFDRVLAVGVEHLSTQFAGAIVPEPTDPDGRTGLAMPALYALQANRHLHDHRLDAELLGHVAVKNKRQGAGNPRAHLADDTIDLDRVLDSRPIAGPLTLLQCCPMTDGAAAAVIESATIRPDRERSVDVVSSRFASGRPWGSHTSLPWGYATVRDTASAAVADAGVSIDDIDVFEVHDAFTIGEILTVEALGICEPGTGLGATASGVTSLGGPRPVNPSGGLLSRGHPLGATGLAQVSEITWQLRADAGDRQVSGAATGLVETMGGGAAGVDANACVVAVLRARS